MSQNRLSAYKNNGKDDEYRKRMKDNALELRKLRRDDQVNKRRNLQDIHDFNEDEDSIKEGEKKTQKCPMTVDQIVLGTASSDIHDVLEATKAARRILSKEINPPIDIFIEAGLVPTFVNFLLRDDLPSLQFEAAWALTNIASGDQRQTKTVVDAGACQLFIRLLESPEPKVLEQAIWALANIAGDGPQFRDIIIESSIVPKLTRLVTHETVASLSPAFLGNVAWCISNLCRHKIPAPKLEAIIPCLETLKILMAFEHPTVVADCCWSLSYLSDGTNDRIEAVCQMGVIPQLVELCMHSPDRMILVPACRTLGNIVTGNDVQTQVVVDSGALLAFKHLLTKSSLNMRKECVWALSNITAGNQTQIQSVIDHGLIEPIIEILSTGDAKSQKEASWTLSNLTCGGSPAHIAFLVRAGVLEPLSAILSRCTDSRLIIVILDAFKNILNAASTLGEIDTIVVGLEEIGFVDKLEMLQMHENEDVYKNAMLLLETFWGTEEEDASVAPAANPNEDGYSFSPAAAGSETQNFQF